MEEQTRELNRYAVEYQDVNGLWRRIVWFNSVADAFFYVRDATRINEKYGITQLRYRVWSIEQNAQVQAPFVIN